MTIFAHPASFGILVSRGHRPQIRLGDFNGSMEALHVVIHGEPDEDGVRFICEDLPVEVCNAPFRPPAGSAAVDHGRQPRAAFVEGG